MLEDSLSIGCAAWSHVQIVDGNCALPTGSVRLDNRVECGECDRQVRGMDGDACVAGPKQCVHAVLTVQCGAAGPRTTFVARKGRLAEVRAASALEQIATDRAHVADLR